MAVLSPRSHKRAYQVRLNREEQARLATLQASTGLPFASIMRILIASADAITVQYAALAEDRKTQEQEGLA